MNVISVSHRHFFYLISLIIIIFYVYLQFSYFLKIPEPYQEPDSLEFLYPESTPYPWGSVKPPFVPFIYKLLGRDIELIVIMQLVFSIFSWIFLACVLANLLKCNYLIPFAFIFILGLSLSDTVSMWNKSILGESLSLSILSCFVGAWLLVIEKMTIRRVVILIIVSIIFTLTRAVNGFILLMIAVIILIFISLYRRLYNKYYYLLISFIFIILFLISNIILNANNRWVPYFLNIVSMRILPNSEILKYFQEHGMPVSDNLMARSNKWAHEDNYAYYKDPNLEQFRNWVYSKGKLTYFYFLLTHPAYLISEPLHDFQRMIFSTQSRLMYYAPKGFESPLSHNIFKYLSAWSLFHVYVFLTGVLFGLNLIYVSSKKRKVLWVPLIMTILVFPLIILTWHADAMEIERHALPVAVQARLSFIFLLLFTIDIILSDKKISDSFQKKR